MPATNQQVQNFVDQQVRPSCEAIRDLVFALQSALAQIGDVYAAVTEQSPTWTDTRTDGPPHLATPGDVVNWNGFATRLVAAATGDSQWSVIQNLCVRSPQP